MKLNKTLLSIFIISILLITLCFSRGPEQITQELAVEQAIRTKAEVTIGKLLNYSEFVIIVNATMSEKPLSLSGQDDISGSENESNEGTNFLSTIGIPTIPPKQKIAPPSTNGVINYSTDQFLLYHLEIAVYLEENKATGKMKQDITRLIKDAIPDIADCDDCIRFETMKLGGDKEGNYQELLAEIEELEEDRRKAEAQIRNWKLDQLQTQLAVSEDARSEWETQARTREEQRRIEDSIRLAKYIKIETEYRKKQDSLILVTAQKLDNAISGRIESESNTASKLLDIIKDGYGENSSLDDNKPLPATNNTKGEFKEHIILYIMLIVMFFLLVAVLILLVKKKNNNSATPVYLKPVKKNNSQETKIEQQPTAAHESQDVARSELNSLRQSAVSMSIGQKDGATQIVKDWLDSEGGNETEKEEDTKE